MTFGGRYLVLASAMFFAVLNPQPGFAAVQAKFSLDSPAGGPFPSDRFTIADLSQNTGRRVNLPLPDCAVRQSDCEDLAVINTLDGFHIEPRLSIPFDGPINLTTVSSETVFLVSLDDRDEATDGYRVIGINQVVWDVATNTLHVEADALLDQHTRYALLATKKLLGTDGKAVKAAKAFLNFVDDSSTESTNDVGLDAYRMLLRDTLRRLDAAGVIPRGQVVAATVFTTQSVTAVLERIRDQIKAATPDAADFGLGPGGAPTVFALNTMAGITWRQHTGDNPPEFITPKFTTVPVDLSVLRVVPGMPDAVGTIAFGKFTSPDYEVHPGEFSPPIGTRTGTPVVQGTNEIYFNLFLPSGPRPAAGWPVAIFGHGTGESKNRSFNVAATMAAHGIATIAINAPGHGFGPFGTLTVNQTVGQSVTFSAGGRGIDQNHDHVIAAAEGFGSAPPQTIILFADGIRQTVADLLQLVRVIQVGVDVDGDGSPDLDFIAHLLLRIFFRRQLRHSVP